MLNDMIEENQNEDLAYAFKEAGLIDGDLQGMVNALNSKQKAFRIDVEKHPLNKETYLQRTYRRRYGVDVLWDPNIQDYILSNRPPKDSRFNKHAQVRLGYGPFTAAYVLGQNKPANLEVATSRLGTVATVGFITKDSSLVWEGFGLPGSIFADLGLLGFSWTPSQGIFAGYVGSAGFGAGYSDTVPHTPRTNVVAGDYLIDSFIDDD